LICPPLCLICSGEPSGVAIILLLSLGRADDYRQAAPYGATGQSDCRSRAYGFFLALRTSRKLFVCAKDLLYGAKHLL
jgi:hypothetical protein